jgi:hypothetical protein
VLQSFSKNSIINISEMKNMPDFSKATAAISSRKFLCALCKEDFPKDTLCHKVSSKTICADCFEKHKDDTSGDWDMLPCGYKDGHIVCPKCEGNNSHIIDYGVKGDDFFFIRTCHDCLTKYKNTVPIRELGPGAKKNSKGKEESTCLQ